MIITIKHILTSLPDISNSADNVLLTVEKIVNLVTLY